MMWIFICWLLFQSPAFEVASVKPTTHRARAVGTMRTFPGGRMTIEGSTLEHLIEVALDVQRFQVSGGQDWMYVEGFDIEAKPPADFPSGDDAQRRMLLALLVERFQLRYHHETKPGLVYYLDRSNKKLKLEESRNRDAVPWLSGPETGIAGGNVSMAVFARRLSRWLDHPVIDRTGLEGSYDFKFEYDVAAASNDVTASVLGSVHGLGLSLDSGKGAVEMVVVDRVERLVGN